MSNNEIKALQNYSEIDLYATYLILMNSKLKIILISMAFAIFSVFYALSIPNQYKASTILVPSANESGGLASSGGIGGVSFGGIRLRTPGESTEAQVAVEIMESWYFIEKFIRENELEVALYAAESWEPTSNTLIINKNIYDQETNSWLIKDKKNGGFKAPSGYKLFQRFKGRLDVSEDKATGFVTVSVEFFSPIMAKEWLDLFVRAINEHMQTRQVQKVSKNIAYLNEQISKTSIAEMREVFYTIIEDQIKSKMLAEASPEYTFIPISPAMIEENKSQPNRAITCIVITFLGGVFACAYVLIQHYRKTKK